ncbi:MAG: hypothetical protein KJ077_24750 [Anaerolineae bacterium]|nr:hypothetical protein [Anaerolineae bacterium]
MSETRERYDAGNLPATDQRIDLLPSEVLSWEMLNAMNDNALIEVYRLLVRLEQRDAAALLAEYARRIAEIDVTQAQSEQLSDSP